MRENQTIDTIFIGRNSLLDTMLDEIVIGKDDKSKLQITLSFSNFNKKGDFETVKIVFGDIEEYNFSFSSDYYFYNIEDYKLINLDSKIYLSLDPDTTTDTRSAKDLDFILSNKVELIS